MSNPYIRKDPGDIMLAADWNDMQVQARDELHKHGHTGGDDGVLLDGKGIAANAIDGSHINPGADVTVKSLRIDDKVVVDEINKLADGVAGLKTGKQDRITGDLTMPGTLSVANLAASGSLKAKGRDVLADIDGLLASLKSVTGAKLDLAGGMLTGSLSVGKDVAVTGKLSVGGDFSLAGTLSVAGGLKLAGKDVSDSITSLQAALANKLDKSAAVPSSPTFAGDVTVGGKLTVSKAIVPSAGNTETSGLMFPKDPGGGGSDAAWLRYYARQGEACTLELGIDNDPDDHIALMPSGSVGIKTRDPRRALHVENSEIHAGGNAGGFSFASRDTNAGAFVESPTAGERWVWYALGGTARLWSGGDKLTVGKGGSLSVTGDLAVAGRSKSANAAAQVTAIDHVKTTSTTLGDMPGMALSITVASGPVLVLFKTSGVQGLGQATVRGHFKLLVDGVPQSYAEQEFHNNGWELRDVALMTLIALTAGNHTISVQWRSDGGELHACYYGSTRSIIAVEL